MLRSLKVQSNTMPERSQLVFVETHANFYCVLRIMIKESITLIIISRTLHFISNNFSQYQISKIPFSECAHLGVIAAND